MNKIFTMKYLAGAALLACSLSASAEAPAGYYDNLEGLSGVTLKKAVKSAASRHTVISYGDDSWSVFLESDTRIVGSQRCWWDMYSNNNVAAPNAGSHGGLNIEHGVPNSWWGKTKNDAYKDLFHLNPSNADANSRKGNYPLGEIATQTWSNGVTFIGRPTSTTGDDAQYVFEPADEYKGDFARAYFYMFTIYDNISWTSSWDWMYNTSSDLTLKPWAYEMLLRWAKEDPVSQKEIDRNEAIYKHQKNRNPFIDYPELAEHIWGSKKNEPFHLNGGSGPGVDPDPTPGPDDPVVDPDKPDTPVPAGYWYPVTSTADLDPSERYVIVSTEHNVALGTGGGASTIVSYFRPCSQSPVVDKSEVPQRLSSVPDDIAVFTLTKSGTGWIMTMSDMDGNFIGHLKSTDTKKVTVTSSASDATVALITPKTNQTDIQFGSIKGTLQYNNQENGLRFTTYTSSQEPIMMYRLEETHQGTTGIGTGLAENADEVIYGIYSISGQKVAVEGISELPKGIYIVVSSFGTKKILR